MIGALHIHDLILLRSERAVTSTEGAPACPHLNPNQRPWVVVRRGRIADGLIPVGVRGAQRHERCAGFTRVTEVREARRPDQLRLLLAEDSRRGLQAFRSLSYLESHLAGLDLTWGPGGSVGPGEDLPCDRRRAHGTVRGTQPPADPGAGRRR